MITHYFEEKFETPSEISGFTPGRVNLIGEHTDYNGGFVLPSAIPLGLDIALSRRSDNIINLYSASFDDAAMSNLESPAKDHWSDYGVGAIQMAVELGFINGGADIAVQTNLPFGAGLSSSAAITVGILKLCRDLSGSKMSDTEIAVNARRIENEYIGMPCGIMDQMAVAISRPGQALKLNTDTLEFDLVSLPSRHHMAVIHSGHYRRLSEGRYKIRKEECDVVKSIWGRDDICLASFDDLSSLTEQPSEILRRARHCITEHRRTLDAAEALQNGEMERFGRLMIESHLSMRDDFEITLPEMDEMAEDLVNMGALGARMTGGGFGGCIVACIANEQIESVKTAFFAKHKKAFYVC